MRLELGVWWLDVLRLDAWELDVWELIVSDSYVDLRYWKALLVCRLSSQLALLTASCGYHCWR